MRHPQWLVSIQLLHYSTPYASIGENVYIPIEYQPPNFLDYMETMPHPDQYLLPAVFIWNPVTYFTLECPLCSTLLKQYNAYWADGSQSYEYYIHLGALSF